MANDDSVVRTLGEEESWNLLRTSTFGRLAVSAGGQIDIFPVNYVVDGHTVVFRTAPGTKLLELTIAAEVAFEVDEHGEIDAWSVVAKGPAARIEQQSEIDLAETLPLSPWIPTLKQTFVRITPTELTGRSFVRAAEPSRLMF